MSIADLVWRLTHRRIARRLDELTPSRTQRTVYNLPVGHVSPWVRRAIDHDLPAPTIERFGER